jgi:hypothetical protein
MGNIMLICGVLLEISKVNVLNFDKTLLQARPIFPRERRKLRLKLEEFCYLFLCGQAILDHTVG